MDIAPTVLDLAGIARPGEFGMPDGTPHRGGSLAPYLASPGGTARPGRVAFSTTSGILRMAGVTRSSVRTPEAKLIVGSPDAPRPEAYDLQSDPGERVNVARPGAFPSLVRPLEDELAAWRSALGGHEPLASAVPLPSDQTERLRALGYID